MPLAEAATRLAGHLSRQDFVDVYAHHDADGIAAGAIACTALLRKGVRFRLRIVSHISPAALSPETPTLLCDLGSGTGDLPPEVMVIDHHIPRFTGELQVNPRLCGIDGERELSSAGAAFLVAQAMGDNRDLAGLVMLGIIGDGQDLAGENLAIFNDAVALGLVSPDKGLLLPGRDDHERLYGAVAPYLHQVSGDEVAVSDLLESASDGEKVSLSKLLSLVVLRVAPFAPATTLESLYGTCYTLGREVISDAHTLAAVVDACGKSGYGGLAASLCLRSSTCLAEAYDRSFQHRQNVIRAIRAACEKENPTGVIEVEDPAVASDVADALSRDCPRSEPLVLVAARSRDLVFVSVRAVQGQKTELGDDVHEVALQLGGFGGGHRNRAGATIPAGRLPQFVDALQRTVAA
ncbi:MAG: DHHA1 domain-containing protein [Methanolinea sp.]|nr:DHHA1 domain-containing protein [Methanolinea sp.]